MHLVVLALVLGFGTCGSDDDDSPTATAPSVSGEASPSVASASPASSDGVPTPDARGEFSGLTLEQAAQVATFPLAVPDPIPDDFVFNSADATSNPATGNLIRVTLHSRWRDGLLDDITVAETQGGVFEPNPARVIETTETIDGTEVRKWVTSRADNTRAVFYDWNQSGMSFLVSGTLPTPETDAGIEQLVAALIN